MHSFYAGLNEPLRWSFVWEGALVKWLWEKTHVLKVVGSNPSAVSWMDIFSQIFVVKIAMFV